MLLFVHHVIGEVKGEINILLWLYNSVGIMTLTMVRDVERKQKRVVRSLFLVTGENFILSFY